MTEFEKNKIFELRTGGSGYKAIASLLGLSRDVVRGYCKRSGLDGDAAVIQKNLEIRKERGLLCGFCGKQMKQLSCGRSHKYCSDECRRSWWRQNTDKAKRKDTAMYKCVCVFCKAEFTSYGNKNRKYCGHECYINDRFKKETERGTSK